MSGSADQRLRLNIEPVAHGGQPIHPPTGGARVAKQRARKKNKLSDSELAMTFRRIEETLRQYNNSMSIPGGIAAPQVSRIAKKKMSVQVRIWPSLSSEWSLKMYFGIQDDYNTFEVVRRRVWCVLTSQTQPTRPRKAGSCRHRPGSSLAPDDSK